MLFFRLVGRAFQLLFVFYRCLLSIALTMVAKRAPAAEKARVAAVRFVASLQEAGPTFVKVGQILSTRADLLSPSVLAALSALQDRAGHLPFSDVKCILEQAWPEGIEKVCRYFDPIPVASASIAQVHKAQLHDGAWVAIKIQRPGIRACMELDLWLLKRLASLLSWIPAVAAVDPVGTMKLVSLALIAQLDFCRELENNEQFQLDFSGNPAVLFPRMYPALCSPQVLVMEWMDGVKILHCAQMQADPKQLARIGFQALLHMVFRTGLIHADLHPGNILVNFKHQMIFLDGGWVIHLDEKNRNALVHFFVAWAQSDTDWMAALLLEQSRDARGDRADLTSALKTWLQSHQGKPLEEIHWSQVLFGIVRILRKHRISLNPTFVAVNMAIALTEGTGRQLHPEINLVTEVISFFQQTSFNETPRLG